MSTRPLLLGHRGARANHAFPENTLASFDRAMTDGCDGFEFDVRLSGDGAAVIAHDANVKGKAIEKSSAVELALPRLEEVLQRYQYTAFLDIELKVQGLERITLDLLGQHRPARGFVVSSFLPEVLLNLRTLDPVVPLGLICETKRQFARWSGLEVEYVIPKASLATVDAIKALKRAGKKIIVWTVDDVSTMQHLADCGVDGIISDYSELLSRTLGD